MNPPPVPHVKFLDGLRGIACLQVITEHYCANLFPKIIFKIGFLGNGDAAVMVFFLISGYVLSGSFEKTVSKPVRTILKRATRLFLPGLIAIYFAAVFVALGRHQFEQALVASGARFSLPYMTNPFGGMREEFTGLTLCFGYLETSVLTLKWLPSYYNSVNPTLWTISTELWGSALVLLLVYIKQRSRPVFWATVFSSVFVIGTNSLSLFTIGYLATSIRREQALAGWALVLLGIALLSRDYVTSVVRFGYYLPTMLRHSFGFNFQHELGAVALFFGVMLLPWAKRILEMPVPQYFGRISFSLYLLHWPILVAFGSRIYLLSISLGLPYPAIWSFIAGVSLTIGLAAWFDRNLDKPAIKLSQCVTRQRAAAPDLAGGVAP